MRAGFVAGLLAAGVVGLSGCSAAPAAVPQPDAAAVISSLGAVPIPTAPAADPVASASPGHGAVLAMGEKVDVTLPGGGTGTLTALGPKQTTTVPVIGPGASTPATITVQVRTTTGALTVDAADLSSRDETGKPIALHPVGAATVSVPAGRTGTVTVGGVFTSGSAQLTLREGGHTLAVWVFTIELD